MRQMLVQQFKAAAAIALRVFDLPADVADGLSFPRHFLRRQVPARMAGNAAEGTLLAGENVQVTIAVARTAGIAGHAAAVDAARGARRMRMHVVALGGPVARGVAVHAARMHDHLRSFAKERARAVLRVEDAGEGGRRAQFNAVLRRNGCRPRNQKHKGAKPWRERTHPTPVP
jgi:hypothetical protein